MVEASNTSILIQQIPEECNQEVSKVQLMTRELNSLKPGPGVKSMAPKKNIAQIALIIDRCPFIKDCIQKGNDTSPEERACLVSVFNEVDHGDLGHIENEGGPLSCSEIGHVDGANHCSDCRFNGVVNSPMDLGNIYPSNLNSSFPFPLHALPECFRPFVEEAAAAIGCPEDFVGLPLVVNVGGLIGNNIRIEVKPGWIESANLFVGIVGLPGVGKSPGLAAGSRFTQEIEIGLRSQYESAQSEYVSELQQYENELAIWKQQDKSSQGGIRALEKAPQGPVKPQLSRISISDITCEAVAVLLKENRDGLILVKDELSGLIKGLNQYKSGKGSDLEFYLSAWNCSPIIVDRKGREPIIVDRPFLGIVGCIPPDVLLEVWHNSVSDGFIDRFLLSWPDPKRQRWSEAVISSEAEGKARSCFIRLFELRKAAELPQILRFSPEALNTFKAWYNRHHQESERADFPVHLRGFWSKLPAQIARLALIIHCCRMVTEQVGQAIDQNSIISALAFADYFAAHARKSYGQVAKPGTGSKVEKLIAWLNKRRLLDVTPRDLVTGKVGGCSNATEAREMLDLLEETGWGLWAPDRKRFLYLPYIGEQIQ